MEIRPNIVHPSTPRSPQWSPSLRFPQQDSIHTPPFLTHTRHVPSTSHFSPFGSVCLFAATLLIGVRSSIRNLRKRHAMVTGTHYMEDYRYTLTK